VLGNEQRELVLVDVTPLNLGIELHGGDMAVIIPAQTPIPCKKSSEFTTVEDMQTSVDTHVCYCVCLFVCLCFSYFACYVALFVVKLYCDCEIFYFYFFLF
jgi:hypothetical protein